MEGPQKTTLEEQVDLAKALSAAVDRRNSLTASYPDLDDLSVFVNASPENRAAYEGVEREANEARTKFDEIVADKKALVKHLSEIGEDELAERITKMFSVK